MASVTTRDYRGWQVVNLETPQLRVDVVPGKGGDLTSVVHLTTGVELLWHTRWGLRARGSMTTPGSSEAALSEAYPGGWQSVFPNAGDAAHEHGSNGRCTVRCGPGLGRAACGGTSGVRWQARDACSIRRRWALTVRCDQAGVRHSNPTERTTED